MMNRYFTFLFVSFQKYLNNGHERSIKAKKNILSLLFLKGISIAISFLLVPLTIHYVNPTHYGIWLTLGSIIGWFSYFDVGLGHGLRNRFAEALAKGNTKEARIYVSTTYISLATIMGVILILFLIINPFLNWANILNADQNMASELGVLALIVFVFFCVQFVFQLISIIITANQDPAKASFIHTLGSLVSLIIIFILTKTSESNILYLGIALSSAPVVMLAVATLWFFNTSYKKYAPSFKFFQFRYIRDLMGLGVQFFIINISVLIMLNTDNIVITHLLGPDKVTVFNVTYKLFTLISMVYLIIGTPLWSAYTEAYVKKDFRWIKNTLKIIKKVWVVLTGLTIIVLLISPWFFELWLGNSVQVPFSLSVAMSTYVVGYIWMNIYTFLLNGLGKIRLQLYVSIFATVIYIPLVIILGKVWGLEGITYLTTFIFVATGIIYNIQVRKLINNSAEGIWLQ